MVVILLIHILIILMLFFSIKDIDGADQMIAAPILFWFLIVFLYVVPFWVMPSAAEPFFLEVGYIKLTLLAFFCGCAFHFGFYLSKLTRQKKKFLAVYSDSHVILFAVLLVSVSMLIYFGMIISIGIFNFYGITHNYGALSNISGYVYQMRDVSFGGVAVLSFYLCQKRLPKFAWVVFYVALCLLIVDAILMGVRGTFIRLLVFSAILFVVKMWPNMDRIKRKKVAKKGLLLGGLLIVLILSMPMLRTVTHLGAESDSDIRRNNVAATLSYSEVIKKSLFGSDTGRGNEMLIASVLIQSAYESSEFDGGYKWLLPIMNFIPRSLWHDKPLWGDFSINIARVMVEAGYWMPIYGSAETGIADSYMRFSWIAPIFWLFLGLFGGRNYRNALNDKDDFSWIIYAAFLLGLVYFLTQNFFPFFYSMFYIMVPIYLIKLFSCLSIGKRLKVIL